MASPPCDAGRVQGGRRVGVRQGLDDIRGRSGAHPAVRADGADDEGAHTLAVRPVRIDMPWAEPGGPRFVLERAPCEVPGLVVVLRHGI